MDWFERLTGFPETDYDVTRERLEVDGCRLRSRVNGKSYAIGALELVPLQTLRERVRSGGGPPGRSKVRVVTVHAIWGWMLIGAIHSCRSPPIDVSRWAAGHPHLSGLHPKDDVFVAADEMYLNGRRVPGAGFFASRPERVLTAHGATRSHWHLPAWMHPDAGLATLSCHGDQKRWSIVDTETCGLLSVPIGQEFVLNTTRQDLPH